jgi:hypothetical protein
MLASLPIVLLPIHPLIRRDVVDLRPLRGGFADFPCQAVASLVLGLHYRPVAASNSRG